MWQPRCIPTGNMISIRHIFQNNNYPVNITSASAVGTKRFKEEEEDQTTVSLYALSHRLIERNSEDLQFMQHHKIQM